jgi:DNA mismatch endonuclease (patch repair protein)
MADVFNKKTRSRVMAAIRSRGNKRTELRLISILRRNRLSGWRRHERIIGNPDFVFRRERVAVFVDGCFWHGCDKHGRQPGSNRRYWTAKLARNKRRDKRYTADLKQAGWTVIRLWQHDLESEPHVTRLIKRALNRI